MSDQVELTDPVDHSVGGFNGHIARRVFHISMAILPWLYFVHGDTISESVNLNKQQFVSAGVIALILIETIRLKIGFTVYGQRDYEATQVSALAWGSFAVGITFLCLPNSPEYVYPLIFSLSLGDPFLGELRRIKFQPKTVFIGGTIFMMILWIVSWHFYETPLWLAPIMAPICVAAEWPRLRWIDDNATMLLIPLTAILLIAPWM